MKKYSIYTLTDPRNNNVYYVGSTVNTVRRRAVHVRGYDTTSAKEKSAEIIADGREPVFEVVDAIETDYKVYGLMLEACWRSKLRQSGCLLVNERNTGLLGEVGNPEHEMINVKTFSNLPPAEYQNHRIKQAFRLGY